jgi:hypothetical protein
MLIAVSILLNYWLLLRLIDSGHQLSQVLQNQKSGLKLMSLLVFISYFLCSIMFFFYGDYRRFMSLYARWLIYPILAILIELPNMLIIYVIHWRTYTRPREKESPVPIVGGS